jgi:hypothetical protein
MAGSGVRSPWWAAALAGHVAVGVHALPGDPMPGIMGELEKKARWARPLPSRNGCRAVTSARNPASAVMNASRARPDRAGPAGCLIGPTNLHGHLLS